MVWFGGVFDVKMADSADFWRVRFGMSLFVFNNFLGSFREKILFWAD
jgi:hypothetical protein